MAAPGNAWYIRSAQRSHGRWAVRCHQNDLFEDGSTVDESSLVAMPPDHDVLWRADVGDHDRAVITVSELGAPGAPDAWFVAIRDEASGRPRMTLVAFCTDHMPDGTVVPDAAFFTMRVRSNEQAGALRWWADTAVVDEIYVHPDERRSHLGSKLIYTASGYHQHHGWPDRLHSDGRRTDLGQEFVVGLRHPTRMARWTHRAAPMTPGGSG